MEIKLPFIFKAQTHTEIDDFKDKLNHLFSKIYKTERVDYELLIQMENECVAIFTIQNRKLNTSQKLAYLMKEYLNALPTYEMIEDNILNKLINQSLTQEDKLNAWKIATYKKPILI